ncbi:hypothetical protein AAHA92_32850 [Salvia divinorum]|uniref:Uncharacterized protein n=1 Tax=Salvia divinorum TaxID=28513 RepID=A0ABD1FMJ1_SALDI
MTFSFFFSLALSVVAAPPQVAFQPERAEREKDVRRWGEAAVAAGLRLPARLHDDELKAGTRPAVEPRRREKERMSDLGKKKREHSQLKSAQLKSHLEDDSIWYKAQFPHYPFSPLRVFFKQIPNLEKCILIFSLFLSLIDCSFSLFRFRGAPRRRQPPLLHSPNVSLSVLTLNLDFPIQKFAISLFFGVSLASQLIRRILFAIVQSSPVSSRLRLCASASGLMLNVTISRVHRCRVANGDKNGVGMKIS